MNPRLSPLGRGIVLLVALACCPPAMAASSGNAPPVITLPGNQATPRDIAVVFSIRNGNALSVMDAEAGDADIRLTVSVERGTLTVAASTGIDIQGRETAELVLTGPWESVNQELNGLRYTPPNGFQGVCRLDVLAEDLDPVSPLSASDDLSIRVFVLGEAEMTAPEGSTVALPAPAGADTARSVRWAQTGGAAVRLSSDTSATPTFVAPPAGASRETWLSFASETTPASGSPLSGTLVVRITDNGITGYPDDAIPFRPTTSSTQAIRVTGGYPVRLEAVNPASIAEQRNRPESLPYGLSALDIRVDAAGGSVEVEVFLEASAATDAAWFKYDDFNGWYRLDKAVFADDRMSATFTLTDGGRGDADLRANGLIRDPMGLGIPRSGGTPPDDGEGDGDEGGGGCFLWYPGP